MFENGSKETIVTCEVGLDSDSCKDTEECVASNSRSRNGICKCKSNFVRNEENVCIQKAATIGKSKFMLKIFAQDRNIIFMGPFKEQSEFLIYS